jgi:hypothetical protein
MYAESSSTSNVCRQEGLRTLLTAGRGLHDRLLKPNPVKPRSGGGEQGHLSSYLARRLFDLLAKLSCPAYPR